MVGGGVGEEEKKKRRKKGSSGGGSSSISERLKVDLIFTLRQISVKDDTRVRGVPHPPQPTPPLAPRLQRKATLRRGAGPAKGNAFQHGGGGKVKPAEAEAFQGS